VCPEEPRPTRKEAQAIITRLMTVDCVTPIPGYPTFRDFTLDWQAELQSCLNQTRMKRIAGRAGR